MKCFRVHILLNKPKDVSLALSNYFNRAILILFVTRLIIYYLNGKIIYRTYFSTIYLEYLTVRKPSALFVSHLSIWFHRHLGFPRSSIEPASGDALFIALSDEVDEVILSEIV